VRKPLLLLLLPVAGCIASPPRSYEDVKEVYVEAAPVVSAGTLLRRVGFPFNKEMEEESFVSVRSFSRGAIEAHQKLGQVLDQWPPRGSDRAAPGVVQAPPTLDVSSYPPNDPPVLLVALTEVEKRDESGCYVGHSVFLGDEQLQTGLREVVHHVRLVLVNRESDRVRLDAADVLLEVPDGVEPYELVASADGDGARATDLEVAPGEHALLHLFFAGTSLPETVRLRWRARLVERPGARPVGPREWTFEVRLQRRYVVDPGIITALEDAAARRLDLPPPKPKPRDPWREPRMEAMGGR
jgi:hypothetical protein